MGGSQRKIKFHGYGLCCLLSTEPNQQPKVESAASEAATPMETDPSPAPGTGIPAEPTDTTKTNGSAPAEETKNKALDNGAVGEEPMDTKESNPDPG